MATATQEKPTTAGEQARLDSLNDSTRGQGKKVGDLTKKVEEERAARAKAKEAKTRKTLDKAVAVLKKSEGPMHNRELADKVGDVSYDSFYIFLKGNPEVFVKTGPGRFDLKELNPKATALRPGQKPPAEEPKKTPAKAKASSKGKASKAKSSSKAKGTTTPVAQREEAKAAAGAAS